MVFRRGISILNCVTLPRVSKRRIRKGWLMGGVEVNQERTSHFLSDEVFCVGSRSLRS